MEDKKIMAFKDETGNKVEFEVIAEIYLDEDTEKEKKYLLLSPVEGGNEDDMFAFRVDVNETGEEYNLVEDDAELNEIKKVYKSLLY